MAKQAKLKNYFFKPSRSNDDNTDNEMAIPPAVNETVDALAPDRKKQDPARSDPNGKIHSPG